MITLENALISLKPNAEWTLEDDSNASTLIWQDEVQTEPTTAEINAEVIRLQAEYDSQEYARKRKAEYDQLNQFELISDDSINGTTTHKDAILAIKTKYPKE